MPVVNTLNSLRQLQIERVRSEINVYPAKPTAPKTLKVTGLKFGFRIEWSQVEDADGYRVAVTTTNNLAAPDRYIGVEGNGQLEFVWTVGDVAITRQFSVQSFKRAQSGEVLYSDFRYPLVSATSKDAAGAADAAPGASPSAPVSPPSGGSTGDPGGVGGHGGGAQT